MDPLTGGGEDERRLDSWKEIAAFFKRDQRTVKRWEKERALPVHRIPGNGRGGVYAYSRELRRWLEQGGTLAVETPNEPQAAAASPGGSPAEPARPRRPVLFLVLLLGTAGVLWVAAAARQLTLARSTPAALRGADPELARGYLACRYAWSKRTAEHLRDSVNCFTQLLVRDPGFAPAYAGLADSYNLLREYSLMPDAEAFPRAITAARKAVELDPSSSLGHRALAFGAFHWSFDVLTAEREFRTALDLDPQDAEAHHWFATALMLLGRNTEAVAEIGRAQELEPTSSSIIADRALILHHAGRGEEAMTTLDRLTRTEPELVSPHRYLQEIHFGRAGYGAALTEARRVAELLHDPEELRAVDEEMRVLEAGGPSALLEAMRRTRLARYERGPGGAYPLAQVEALLAQREVALAHLEEACAGHEPAAMGMRIDPTLGTLHQEPQFRKLLARLGLPPVE
jgi:tetratricopeptide (TPR) repeat protein